MARAAEALETCTINQDSVSCRKRGALRLPVSLFGIYFSWSAEVSIWNYSDFNETRTFADLLRPPFRCRSFLPTARGNWFASRIFFLHFILHISLVIWILRSGFLLAVSFYLFLTYFLDFVLNRLFRILFYFLALDYLDRVMKFYYI